MAEACRPRPDRDHPARRFLARLREPKWRLVRLPLGVALIACGVLGFLPVVGFWMLPLGLAVLAIDWPLAGRLLRQVMRAAWRLRRAWRAAIGRPGPPPGPQERQ